MLVWQVLPAILSPPFVIQIVCSTSLEADICIPKTLLNKQNCDIKVVSDIWNQITESPELQPDLESALQADRERALSKNCSLPKSPAGMIPESF